jgi:hypothetical protein
MFLCRKSMLNVLLSRWMWSTMHPMVTGSDLGPFAPLVRVCFDGKCHTRFSQENQVQTYMHARIKFHAYSDIKVYTEIVLRKKKKDHQSLRLNPGNKGSKHHRQSTGGCVRLAPAHLHSSFLFLSNIVYSKGEHLSYSASVGKRMNAKAL